MLFFNENNLIDAQRYSGNTKCSVQQSGRIGFTKEGAELLGLEKDKRLLISEMENGDLAAIICDSDETRGFKIQVASGYCYAKMKNYFDSLGIDYVANRVSYSIAITSEQYQGKPVFKFTREMAKRKESDKEEIPEDNNDDLL